MLCCVVLPLSLRVRIVMYIVNSSSCMTPLEHCDSPVKQQFQWMITGVIIVSRCTYTTQCIHIGASYLVNLSLQV